MKTEQELKQLIAEIEDEMQFVNTRLKKALSAAESSALYSKREELNAQLNILLEVLK